MAGVLRMARLNGLLGAHVHGDGNDGQDADVPERGQTGSETPGSGGLKPASADLLAKVML